MKKVCHVSSAHPQRDTRILLKECVSLTKEYEVHLVVLNGEDEVFENVHIHSAYYPIKKRLDRFTKGVKAVYKKALEVNADVYHLHDPELLQIAGKLKRKGKIVIFDSHEDLPLQIRGKYWINKNVRGVVARAAEFYENRAARKIDAIVAATPSIASRFEPVARKVVVLNNYPLLNELASTTPWSEKKEEACYVGGITEIRGCTEVIQAFYNPMPIKLNFAGNYAPESYRDQLIKLDGWQSVIEYGFVSRKDVAGILAQSKYGLVVLHPVENHIESQPIKMFEYMSAGIPVIASSFPWWKQIIEGNNCGICVEPKNPEAIREALLYLKQNDDLARQMGENGRAAVIEKYNWEQEEIKILDLYRSLLSKA